MEEMYPAVRADLMKKALTAFDASAQKQKYKRGWSTKAGDAVCRVVSEEYWKTQFAYVKRCHGIRNLIKDRVPKSLRIWVLPDGSLHDALIAAVALAPLRSDGKFRIKELVAIAKRATGQSNAAVTAATSESAESS